MIPIPINSVEHVIFSKKHDFPANGWQSLKPYGIAIRIGTKVAEYGTAGMNVTAFPNYDKVFTLVAQERYDICISSVVTGWYYIKKYNLKGLKILAPPLREYQLYHYLHVKNKALVPKISHSLQQMQQDGEITRERALAIDETFK